MTAAILLTLLAAAAAAAGLVEAAGGARGRPARARPRIDGDQAWVARLARIGRGAGSLAPSRGLAERLAAAGLEPRVRPADAMAAKAGAGAVASVAALAVAALLPAAPAIACVAAAACAGFLAPDLWLRRRARARAALMSRELPDVVDLLRVAIGAGLPVTRALAEVARRRRGALAAELRAVALRVELGMPPAQAIGQLPARCPVPGVAALAAALERAERDGAPVAPTLTALAAQARADRARRLREDAARAAPKMQLVVALLLAPAVMLAVGAALAAALSG